MILLFSPGRILSAAEEKPVNAQAYSQAVDRAIEYLLEKGRASDGSFSKEAGPGVTALDVAGILKHGRSPDDPAVAKSLKYLEGFVQPDGGISKKTGIIETTRPVWALVVLRRSEPRRPLRAVIKNAENFLKDNQWSEKQGRDQADAFYGGAGYGKHKRPDLSNTNFLLDALKGRRARARTTRR